MMAQRTIGGGSGNGHTDVKKVTLIEMTWSE